MKSIAEKERPPLLCADAALRTYCDCCETIFFAGEDFETPSAQATEGSAGSRAQAARSSKASRARVVIPAQSPAAIALAGATHEPPTHMTLGSDR